MFNSTRHLQNTIDVQSLLVDIIVFCFTSIPYFKTKTIRI